MVDKGGGGGRKRGKRQPRLRTVRNSDGRKRTASSRTDLETIKRTGAQLLHDWQASYDPRWAGNPLYMRYGRDNPGPIYEYPPMDRECRPRTSETESYR